MTWYWVSSRRMTVGVAVDYSNCGRGRVCVAPPIVKRFIGQPFGNLIDWMERQSGFRMELLS